MENYKKDYVLARQLAERAQVDAKVTDAKASAAKMQQATDELQKSNRVLHNEIKRNSK